MESRPHAAPCCHLLQCQKRPTTLSKETYYSVKRDLLQCQKRPTTASKETYYSVCCYHACPTQARSFVQFQHQRYVSREPRGRGRVCVCRGRGRVRNPLPSSAELRNASELSCAHVAIAFMCLVLRSCVLCLVLCMYVCMYVCM